MEGGVLMGFGVTDWLWFEGAGLKEAELIGGTAGGRSFDWWGRGKGRSSEEATAWIGCRLGGRDLEGGHTDWWGWGGGNGLEDARL